MDPLHPLLAAAAAITAVTAALAAVGKAVRWVIRTARKLGRLADELLGVPAEGGKPAQPGLLSRLARVEATQQKILTTLQEITTTVEELRPNGGSSMRDKVDALVRKAGIGHEGKEKPIEGTG